MALVSAGQVGVRQADPGPQWAVVTGMIYVYGHTREGGADIEVV